jgi:hypothetical protein
MITLFMQSYDKYFIQQNIIHWICAKNASGCDVVVDNFAAKAARGWAVCIVGGDEAVER